MTSIVTSRDLPEYDVINTFGPEEWEQRGELIDGLSGEINGFLGESGLSDSIILESLTDVLAEFFVRHRCIGTARDTRQFAEEVHERIWDFIVDGGIEDLEDIFAERLVSIGAHREALRSAGGTGVPDGDPEDECTICSPDGEFRTVPVRMMVSVKQEGIE